MHLLIVDTSTQFLTLGLLSRNRLYSVQKSTNHYTAEILSSIDNLLRQASLELGDLNYIAEGVGPGSFAGCKVSRAVIQGLAVCHKHIKLIHFSSMHALALSHSTPEVNVGVIMKANIRSFYFGEYSNQVHLEQLISLQEIPHLCTPTLTWGDQEACNLLPHLHLMFKPIQLELLLPVIEDSISKKKFASLRSPRKYHL